jgi:phage baseplate assembly protein W
MNKYVDNYGIHMKATFTGFSTVSSSPKENFKLYDIDLIRQDLLNHFHTRIGERVMRPEFGCRIWDYLLEQFTPSLKAAIISEATRICSEDPRVEIVGVEAFTGEQTIRVEITLNFITFDTVDQFIIDFENKQSEQGY